MQNINQLTTVNLTLTVWLANVVNIVKFKQRDHIQTSDPFD